MHTDTTIILKPNLRVPCCYVLYFLIYVFSALALKILNLYNKVSKRFSFHTFGLKCCRSSSLYTMLKLSNTISPQKLFQSDCITL